MAAIRELETGASPKSSKLFLIHGGPGAQGSLHGLCNSLQSNLNPCEVLQRYSGEKLLSVQTHVDDMAAIVQPGSYVLGHSWGAMLTLSFACQYSLRCRQLILVGCGTYSETARQEYVDRILLRLDTEKAAFLKEEVERAQTQEARAEAFRVYGEYATSVQAYDPIADPFPDPNPRFDPDGHPQTWSDAMRLQAEGIEPARFASIKCPVTLIQGEEDPHPGCLIKKDLEPYIPHLEFIELPKCGHQPWLERKARERFLELVAEICHR